MPLKVKRKGMIKQKVLIFLSKRVKDLKKQCKTTAVDNL